MMAFRGWACSLAWIGYLPAKLETGVQISARPAPNGATSLPNSSCHTTADLGRRTNALMLKLNKRGFHLDA